MKVLRFATGLCLLTLATASVACAQQATTRSRKAEEKARCEQEAARADLERAMHQTETARAQVECGLRQTQAARAQVECALREAQVARAQVHAGMQDAQAIREQVQCGLRQAEIARAQVERCLQDAAVARAAADEDDDDDEEYDEDDHDDGDDDEEVETILERHLQDAEKWAVEGKCAEEIAEQVRAAIAQHVEAKVAYSDEMKREIEEAIAAGQATVFRVDGGELAHVLQGYAQDDRASQPLKERIRALEERLGIDGEEQEKSLEERVEELERRTMGREVRRARAPGQNGMPGLRALRPGHAVPGLPPVGNGPGAPEGFTPQFKSLRGLGRLDVPAPVPPTEPAPVMGHPGHPFEAAEPPEAPEPPATPDADPFLKRTRAEFAAPSAPRRARASGRSDLSPERRQEIEEVMRRMRSEMEKLRTEMNRLRDELSSNESMRSLRGLGYVGGGEGGAR